MTRHKRISKLVCSLQDFNNTIIFLKLRYPKLATMLDKFHNNYEIISGKMAHIISGSQHHKFSENEFEKNTHMSD